MEENKVETGEKELTLAEQVLKAEDEVTEAMFKAALPILEKYGYTGIKNIRIFTSEPDKEGNVTQTLQVML